MCQSYFASVCVRACLCVCLLPRGLVPVCVPETFHSNSFVVVMTPDVPTLLLIIIFGQNPDSVVRSKLQYAIMLQAFRIGCV